MAEYFDLGTNILSMMDALVDIRRKFKKSDVSLGHHTKVRDESSKFHTRSLWIDSRMFEVRKNSVCVAGFSRDAVLTAKTWIAGLLPDSMAIESFHVKLADDVKDGALFVPKVVLVATHRPGQKLLDHTSQNGGQLDSLYDEVCQTGADVLIIYMDLPLCLYPPNKRSIYHERIGELLFPGQPLLKELALENQLITVSAHIPSPASKNSSTHHGLNQIQRNVVREWLERPVQMDHGVYRAAAEYLSHRFTRENSIEDRYYSESEVIYRQRKNGIPRGLAIGWSDFSSGFASAIESRNRSDDENIGGRPAKRVLNRKRKSYGSVAASTTSVGGGNGNRRRRRDDSNELLRPLLEAANFDESDLDDQELLAVHGINDNLGFARECLLPKIRSTLVTTYHL